MPLHGPTGRGMLSTSRMCLVLNWHAQRSAHVSLAAHALWMPAKLVSYKGDCHGVFQWEGATMVGAHSARQRLGKEKYEDLVQVRKYRILRPDTASCADASETCRDKSRAPMRTRKAPLCRPVWRS